MKARFLADGWESNYLYAYTFSSTKSNASIAQDVANRVNEIKAATGAAKVDIIAHSMGSLSSRYYPEEPRWHGQRRRLGVARRPNHGTTWAYGCCFISPCNQMLPGSSFLNALNSGDDARRGELRYVAVAVRWLVLPSSSTSLSGATNTPMSCDALGAADGPDGVRAGAELRPVVNGR